MARRSRNLENHTLKNSLSVLNNTLGENIAGKKPCWGMQRKCNDKTKMQDDEEVNANSTLFETGL
jgi:hypothetical protein